MITANTQIEAHYITPDVIQKVKFSVGKDDVTDDEVWILARQTMQEKYGHSHVDCWTRID